MKIYNKSYIYNIHMYRKFAIFETSTNSYGITVWSQENLKATSCLGHKSSLELIRNILKKSSLSASVLKTHTAKFRNF